MGRSCSESLCWCGSDAKQGASKFINDVFGLSISGVSESDILDKMFSELTINEAARLKGSLSDKDVLFFETGHWFSWNDVQGADESYSAT